MIIIFSTGADDEVATALARGAGFDNPLHVRLEKDRPPPTHGEALVAVGFWSAHALADGYDGQLERILSLRPRRAVLCRLDDAPLAGRLATLDPGVMILGPAPAQQLAPALASAIELAGKRAHETFEAEPTTSKGGAPTRWAVVGLVAIFGGGLSAAGLAAWNTDAPLKPLASRVSSAAPDRPGPQAQEGPDRATVDRAARSAPGAAAPEAPEAPTAASPVQSARAEPRLAPAVRITPRPEAAPTRTSASGAPEATVARLTNNAPPAASGKGAPTTPAAREAPPAPAAPETSSPATPPSPVAPREARATEGPES